MTSLSGFSIQPSTFEEVEPIWAESLWPGRKDRIEPVSAIGPGGTIEMAWYENAVARFWKCTRDAHPSILGVASGLLLEGEGLRIRGFWLDESVRGLGLGRALMNTVLAWGKMSGAPFAWTLARESACGYYEACGFKRGKKIVGYEFGPHVLLRLDTWPHT